MTDPLWPPSDPMFPEPVDERWAADPVGPRGYDHVAGRAFEQSDVLPGERLTHLVLVDGRLVDVWTEPVESTRWAAVARVFDRAGRPEPAPAPVDPPRHESVLAWLDDVVGGRQALLALTTASAPAPDEAPDLLPAHLRDRWQAVRDLLSAVSDECFDAPTEAALHRALDRLVVDDPQSVAAARSAVHLAGGLCWLVGKANGLFGAHAATQGGVRDLLGLSPSISTLGPPLQRSFGTPWPASAGRYGGRSWYGAPDLLTTGCVDLLTDRTRRMVVRMRDRALEEAARTGALDQDAA